MIKNFHAILDALEKEKSNNTLKGDLIKNTFATSTMGVSYKVKLRKALEEANGNMDLAIEELRKTSGVKASKKSGRSAADGLVGIVDNGQDRFMIEVNCETDFVARDESYIQFTEETLKTYANNSEKNLEQLLEEGVEANREK